MKELLKRLECCENYLEQVEIIRSCLEERGINLVSTSSSTGRSTDYYIGKDTVLALIELSYGERFPVVIDSSFFDKYLKDGKGSISLNYRNKKRKNYKFWYCSDREQMELHRLVMQDAGYDITGKIVDHKFHSPLINTLEALRPCTAKQNAWNRDSLSYKGDKKKSLDLEKMKERGEFAYNPLEDYSVTWYAYVIHKLTGDITADELREYNRDLCMRSEDTARYYASILES